MAKKKSEPAKRPLAIQLLHVLVRAAEHNGMGGPDAQKVWATLRPHLEALRPDEERITWELARNTLRDCPPPPEEEGSP
jgi:hypothetical protein